jgi:hypothetical protein
MNLLSAKERRKRVSEKHVIGIAIIIALTFIIIIALARILALAIIVTLARSQYHDPVECKGKKESR